MVQAGGGCGCVGLCQGDWKEGRLASDAGARSSLW